MPAEAIAFVALVVTAFLTFGITLGWADLTTAASRRQRHPAE